MKTELQLPAFASEKEEAEWWDARADETDQEMADAITSGSAQNLHEFLTAQGVMVETQQVTLSVLPDDIDLAKVQATRKGMSYEAYLSSLVHEALRARVAA